MNRTGKSVAVLTIILALSFTVSTRPVSAATTSSDNVGQVVCTIAVGGFLGDMAVDTANGNVYIGRGEGGGNIMNVLSGCSNTGPSINLGPNVVGTGHPGFDGTNGNMYVPVCSPFPCDPGNVTVVSTLTNTVVASFPVLAVPNQALYDPANGLLYVTDRGNGGARAGLSVIDPLTNTIVKTFSASQVGQAPLGEAYDSATGNLYVADQFYTNDIIYVISGSTNTVVATVQTPPSIGAGPCAITYDGQNGGLYVAMCDGHTVTIISGTTNTVVGTIFLPDGTATLDYDSANNDVYVPSGGSNNKVSVISGATNTIVGSITVGNGPVDAVYDSFNRDVYVSNQASGTVSVISTATVCIAPPSGLVSWWPGEGNANDIVDSNPGTLEGSVSFAPGIVGQAFSFNGIDGAVETSTTNVMNSLLFTVTAWVNPGLRTDRDGQPFGTFYPNNAVSNDNPGAFGNGFGVNVYPGGSELTVEFEDGFRSVPGVSFTAGQWYHVTIVYSPGNYKAYVNGQLVDDFSYAQGTPDGVNFVRIGKHNDDSATYGTRRFFLGLIDEAQVYNRALTALEIRSIFNAGSAGVCKIGIHVSKFFTDSSLNPLPLDSNGNPEVNVTLAGGTVRSTNPGQVLAWVNVTNTSGSALQSLKLNDTLPMDWKVNPAWKPAVGAIHVFYANATSLANETDITQPSTVTVSTGNPETVHLTIANLTATAIGHPLMPGQSILLSVKLTYALIKTSQSASSYPRNYTDTATAAGWTQPSFTSSQFTGTGSAFFIADAKVVS